MKTRVALLSPALDAVSGVSTHTNLLLRSPLAGEVEYLHFQVGSEGRSETRMQRLARLALGPLRFAAFCARERIEMVHVNSSLDAKAFWRDLAFVAVARWMGLRIFNQIHGGALPGEFFAGRPLAAALLRWFVGTSDAVVVLSRAEEQAYREFAPGAAVSLLPNAIDTVPYRTQRSLRPRSEPLRLVYVGRLVREKGLFEVLDALALLRDDGRTMTLDIAGSGRDADALAERVRVVGLDDAVRMHGPLFGDAKAALWRRGDVFAFPSYNAEGLPYSLLEAMAAGCAPVVATSGAIGDVVADGRDALVVAARDAGILAAALARLDDDRALLERLGAAAVRRVAERHSLQRWADGFAAVYAAASARKGGEEDEVSTRG